MKDYLAICTRCKKSIFVEQNEWGYFCPSCGNPFGDQILGNASFLVDVDLSNEAYEAGQEYFVNTDFREALRYFEKALSINPNHYPAVYQSHMCKIYEEEQYNDADTGAMVAKAIVDSVDKVVKSRVSVGDRINFLSLILKQSYIMLSKYYSRVSNQLIQEENWSGLRTVSLRLAQSLKEIVSIDKEDMMATNPSIVTSCLGIADIGISACQFSVVPRLDSARIEAHILDVPTDVQYRQAKSLCSIFSYYAGNLSAGFCCSQKTDYGPVLFFIDNYVLPNRRRYYYLNEPNQKRFLSLQGELLNTLIADSTFATRFAHRVCYKDFLSNKNDESRTLVVFESVDNCLDSLMPRVRIGKNKKIDIICKGYDTATQLTIMLNDFLGEMLDKDKAYTASKVDAFFGYVYGCVKRYYDKVSKKYREKVLKPKYQRSDDARYYFGFLYQVARCGILGFLIEEVDKSIKNNHRQKLIEFSKMVVDEFAMLNEQMGDFVESTKNSRFNDIKEAFELIKDSNIYYKQMQQKQNWAMTSASFGVVKPEPKETAKKHTVA
ncbi:MAG: tetratricopeptide repeat protein [Firmicutes bacterium]|nr:tetratricopeptide repeat protein [Bacillota bacterium]